MKRTKFETGGIIGASNNIIDTFQLDESKFCKKYEYIPNIQYLSKIINNDWNRKNISFLGFVHSHLHNSKLSYEDIKYAREIIKANEKISEILLGVVDLSCVEDRIDMYAVEEKEVIECVTKIIVL